MGSSIGHAASHRGFNLDLLLPPLPPLLPLLPPPPPLLPPPPPLLPLLLPPPQHRRTTHLVVVPLLQAVDLAGLLQLRLGILLSVLHPVTITYGSWRP